MKKIILSVLVAAAGFQANAQFQQNFDSAVALPAGWAIINAGDPNAWEVSGTVSGGAHSGSNAASITYHSTIAHDDFLILPQIAVTTGVNTRVSFWIRSRSSTFTEPYEVVLSTTNNTSASAFTDVLQAEEEAAATWTKKQFDLSNYVGQSIYIAIRAKGLNEWQLFVDDVTSDALPSCAAVTGLAANGTTASGTTLNWNPVASAYQYVFGPASVTDPNTLNPIDVATNSANLALQPSTSYKAWVRSSCSGVFGDWSDAVVFSTPCGPIASASFPWTEGFEGVASVGSSSFPTCWYKENGGWQTAGAGTSSYDSNAHNGTQFASISYTADNEYLWTPGFNLTANQAYDFSFWFASYGEYDTWDASVFVNTSQTSLGASVVGAPFLSDGTLAPNVYTEVTRTFAPATDGTYYFAIRVNEQTGNPWYLSFDDFMLNASNLSAPQESATAFKFYPNPVKNTLNVSNAEIINAAEVYNVLGQKVLSQAVNATEASLDFSALQAGTYIVKVATANAVKTIKIAKQ